MDPRWRALHYLAHRQHGYITTQQAEQHGLTRPTLHYHLHAGTIERHERGIYRMATYPPSDEEREAVLMLWSRNRAGVPQATLSHETALLHFELGDAFPEKIHLTVPPTFRKPQPDDVRLHKAPLTAEDIHHEHILRFTTPLRTLLDLIRDDYPDDAAQEAIAQALDRGLIRRRTIAHGNGELLWVL